MTTTGLIFRGRKADGSTLYDCPKCGGRGKLELTKNLRLWYCHKCADGGMTLETEFVKGPRIIVEVGRDSEKQVFFPIEDSQDVRYRYLVEKRGLTLKMIEDLRPHSGGQWYIVYSPLYSLEDHTHPTYFMGRSLFDEEPKYRNPPLSLFPEGGKSKNLWGLHRLSKRTQSLVLCEGVFDAVWSRNRVALLGKTISKRQVEIVRDLNPGEITVFLDGDAQKQAVSIARNLSNSISTPIWVVDTPRGKDPDDLGKGFLIKDHRRRVA